jgi:integrase
LIQIEQDGKSKATIDNTRKYLSYLSQHTDLENPEQVKTFIARKQTSEGHKKILSYAYLRYAQYYKLLYVKPKFHPKSRQIKIPTKEKVEALISSAKSPLCIKLRISAETGLRPIQVYSLRVKDINNETKQIYPEPAKNGNAIVAKVSTILVNQLTEYIDKNKLNPNDKLFAGTQDDYCKHYRAYRNRLANKLHDPTIKTIRLYDLRHYFATMTYARTRDILFVKQQMGHKNIDTTLIYTQLLNLNDDEWTCKTAQNIKEATQLIENGFEYVTEIDGTKLFKKRKWTSFFLFNSLSQLLQAINVALASRSRSNPKNSK